MSWCALDVRSPDGVRDAVAAWLVGRTGQAVEERDDGLLIGVAPTEREAAGLLDELRSRFGSEVAASPRSLPEVDWTRSWREGLGPRRIGRLLISPSWSAPADSADTVVIDPESAFGSGAHGSTRTALALLDRRLRPGHRVLDLGAGSGILAIAAAKLGAGRATGVEVDPEVEPIARANIERNGVTDRVRWVTGDAEILAPLLGPVDLVVSNILRSVNATLLPAIRDSLTADGVAIFAGMETDERTGFLPVLEAAGYSALEEAVDDGWWGVAARVS